MDHVRRPKKVAALQGIKIVSIATGSLHCVACDDMGRVFCWGDNDEGNKYGIQNDEDDCQILNEH